MTALAARVPCRARVQIGSLLLCFATAGLFWGTLAAAFPAMQARSGLGEGGFGALLGLMALAAFPVMRLFGPALPRFEARAISLAMTAFATGAVILALPLGPSGLVLGFIVAGGASGALDIALNARTARVETETGARLFNRAHALFPAAMLTASAGTGLARSAGVPVWALLCATAAAFVVAASIERRAGGHVPPQPAPKAPPPRVPLRGALLILALVAAAGAFQEAASNGWLAIYVERARDGSPLLAGFAAAAYTLGLSTGRLLAHALEGRIADHRVVRVAACVAAPAFLALALAPPVAAVVAIAFLAGTGVGPIEPAVFRTVSHGTAGAGRGAALASVTAVAYLGYLLSPPTLGLVADVAGWAALWITAALASAGVIAARWPRP